MYTTTDFVLGVLIPALVAAVILTMPAVFSRRRPPWAGPVALAAAFVAAYPLINNAAPGFPPKTAADWLFWLALPIGVIAGIDAMLRPPLIVRTIIAALTIAGTLFAMLQPAAAARDPAEWWTLLAILSIALTLEWFFADRAVRDDSMITSYVGLLCILAGACALIFLSDSQKYATQAGALVVGGVAALLMIPLGVRRPAVTDGAALAAVGIVGTLFTVSIEFLFMNVTLSNALLIAAAPPLLWLSRFINVPLRRAWMRGIVRLILPAVPVLIALTIAGIKAYCDMGSGYDMDF